MEGSPKYTNGIIMTRILWTALFNQAFLNANVSSRSHYTNFQYSFYKGKYLLSCQLL